MDYKESTISEYSKAYSDTDITFNSLHYKEKDSVDDSTSLILLNDSILDKYRTDLAEKIISKTFTNEEFNKYQYNPKRLSFDLYGTTELWGLLLEVNQLHSVTEFNINPVKVYDGSIISCINSIFSLEKPFIDQNEEEIS